MSLARLFLAALVWLRPDDAVFLLVVVGSAAVSDVLDGLIGRRIHDAGDDIGSWLDPLCDKVFAASAAVAVVVAWHAPWVVLPLLLVRDVLTLALAGVFRLVDADAFAAHDFHARPLGKVTTVLQTIGIVAVVLWPPAAITWAAAAAVVGAAAVLDRVGRVLGQRRRRLA
ncbi:MAG: CDP-alcohol phosphatidyltransferase family protein [Deltaproteobacteria bacterium]|nr:CDP-alcohol phosphatidyltransferase family protein [Deltaproteobacteria bacterium]